MGPPERARRCGSRQTLVRICWRAAIRKNRLAPGMRRERAGRGKPTSGPAPLHAAVGVGCASSRVAAGSAGVSCCNPRCSPSRSAFDRVREGWQARAQIPNADRTFPSTLPPPTGQYRPGERWSERPVLRARRDVEAFPRVAVLQPPADAWPVPKSHVATQ